MKTLSTATHALAVATVIGAATATPSNAQTSTPQTSAPAPQTSTPAPQTTTPAPQTSTPAPQTSAPAPRTSPPVQKASPTQPTPSGTSGTAPPPSPGTVPTQSYPRVYPAWSIYAPQQNPAPAPPTPPDPQPLVHVYIEGGYVKELGTNAKQVQGGYTVGGGINVATAPGSPLEIRLGFDYIYQPLTRAALAADLPSGATSDSGRVETWDGLLDLQFNLGTAGSVRPYVFGGGGVYDRRVEVHSVTFSSTLVCNPYFGFCGYPATYTRSDQSLTKFGWNAGGGLSVPLGPSGPEFFVEGRFTRVVQPRGVEALRFVPITFGIRF